MITYSLRVLLLCIQVGLGIKPGTSVETIVPYLGMIDTALIMTVEPGFGGQKFMHDMMSKVFWHLQGHLYQMLTTYCTSN